MAPIRFVEERASVLLSGPTGVGKTFIAQALGVQICRQRRRVVFTKTNAFLADLAGGRAEGNWQTRLRRYLAPDLAILDDFATARVHADPGGRSVRTRERTLPPRLADRS